MKVYEKYRKRGIYDPQIRLQGRWLADAGVAPGDRIEVEVQPGRIVITDLDRQYLPLEEQCPKSSLSVVSRE